MEDIPEDMAPARRRYGAETPPRQALRQPAQAEAQNDPQVEAGESLHAREYNRTDVRKSIPPGGEIRVNEGLTRAGDVCALGRVGV